jgi:hypothetical protein
VVHLLLYTPAGSLVMVVAASAIVALVVWWAMTTAVALVALAIWRLRAGGRNGSLPRPAGRGRVYKPSGKA